MFRQTVRKPVKGLAVKVLPTDGTGVMINGIPVSVKKVVHNLFRVDIQFDNNRAYICEHPLASLKINGIHDAAVFGIRRVWDFARPEDRSAFILGLGPEAVVGPPDGSISGGLVEAIEKVGIKKLDKVKKEITVRKKVEIVNSHGKLIIEPASVGTGLCIHLRLGSLDPLEAVLDPFKGLKPEIRVKVAKARTPFLIGFCEESAYHTLGDLIGDIAGTCGIDDAYIKAKVLGSIHMLTIPSCYKAEICEAGG